MNTKLNPAKLITIISDEAIKDKILNELRQAKVKGFTVSNASGEGLNSKHISSWEGMNVRIESIVSEAKALDLMKIMSEKYFDKYGVIAFLQDVAVLRKDKFE